MTVKTANYMLMETVTIHYGPNDHKEIPAGSFVTPVETKYVPKHVIDRFPSWSFNKNTDVYIYTKFGFTYCNRKYLRKV